MIITSPQSEPPTQPDSEPPTKLIQTIHNHLKTQGITTHQYQLNTYTSPTTNQKLYTTHIYEQNELAITPTHWINHGQHHQTITIYRHPTPNEPNTPQHITTLNTNDPQLLTKITQWTQQHLTTPGHTITPATKPSSNT